MTKFLVHGDSPHIPTGYGVQVRYLIEQLRADGHQVAVSSVYGIEGGILDWNGIRVYGRGFQAQGNDLIHLHARHWFGDQDGWIITVLDVWGLLNPALQDFNVVAWTPVDHFLSVGAQPNIRQFFSDHGPGASAVPVAMARFGEDMLRRCGLAPHYIPLSVDTSQYRPTHELSNGVTGREMMGVPDDAFVVGMVAMNKDPNDRKGFNEAFCAVAQFMAEHEDVVFWCHTEKWGIAGGPNLVELATYAGIPPHRIAWSGGEETQYGLRIGYTPEMMAAAYTGMDVLLAPSHGEGFCVPIIEAHACGTPVIATGASAQLELVDDGVTGWLVAGQQEWDAALRAWYVTPYTLDILDKLEEAYKADRDKMGPACVAHGLEYDTAHVYETYWRPFIAELTAKPEVLPLHREPMPETDAVAVLVPIYKRTENIAALAESFVENTKPAAATLYFILDQSDLRAVDAVKAARKAYGNCIKWHWATGGQSCASKWNSGLGQTGQPWVLCVGDDVRFHPGWLDAARKLSDRFDVIGTNDTAPGWVGPNGEMAKNGAVARGVHADHFFVRRAYVDEYGSSLEGPGVLAPECYRHWYVDKEIVDLARVRGAFSPCLDSIVEHLHPGYEGNEAARAADPTYMVAVEHSADDAVTFADRNILIQQQRAGLAKL